MSFNEFSLTSGSSQIEAVRIGEELDHEQILDALAIPDLAQEGSDHSINLAREDILLALEVNFPHIVSTETPAIVLVRDSSDTLGSSQATATHLPIYPYYAGSDSLLRAHISANLPAVLRPFIHQGDIDNVIFSSAGLVFRHDVIDPVHLDVFHQMGIWQIVRRDVMRDQPDNLVTILLNSALPKLNFQIVEAKSSYLIAPIDALANSVKAIKIAKAGIILPEVLEASGIDSTQYVGVSMEIGLDRLVMVRKGISDIRLLRERNPRIASQMYDLQPFDEKPLKPSISRDFSYCVPHGTPIEGICKDIYAAFDQHAGLIKEVTLRNVFNYDVMPQAARERLGMRPDQQNVVVRITLHDPNLTLTGDFANQLYDAMYPKIHQGDQL